MNAYVLPRSVAESIVPDHILVSATACSQVLGRVDIRVAWVAVDLRLLLCVQLFTDVGKRVVILLVGLGHWRLRESRGLWLLQHLH